MKLIRPGNVAASNTGGSYTHARPQGLEWRKEWLANQGQYVTLQCGHEEDLNDKAILIIKSFDGCTILCEQCNRFVSIIGPAKRRKPATEQNDEPPF